MRVSIMCTYACLSCLVVPCLVLTCLVLFCFVLRAVALLSYGSHTEAELYVCTHRRPCPCRSRAEGAPRVYNEFELSMYVVMYVCIKLCKCITNARMHVCMFVYIIYVYTSV